jgi:hypothetical protein
MSTTEADRFTTLQDDRTLADTIVGALGGLIVSYGRGLFGWQEAGFRTPTEWALIFEVGAVVFLSAGLAAESVSSTRG